MPKRSFISNRDGRWELFKQVLGGKTVEQLATGVWEDEAPLHTRWPLVSLLGLFVKQSHFDPSQALPYTFSMGTK